jgi:hypothetical protein
MEIKPERDQYGQKKYYCWHGDVLEIGYPSQGKWQTLIYGFFVDNENNDDYMAVGIKRNGLSEGRSGFYYQVLTDYYLRSILDDIIQTAGGNDNYIKILKEVRDGKLSVEEIAKMLE